MLDSFRIFRSNFVDPENNSGEGQDHPQVYEERKSLLGGTTATTIAEGPAPIPGGGADMPHLSSSAPTSGNSLSTSNSSTTGMNPQDDLEQSHASAERTTGAAEAGCGAPSDLLNPLTVAMNSTDPLSATIPTGKEPQSLQSTIVSRRRGRRKKRRRQRSNSSHSEKIKDADNLSSGPLDSLCSMCLRALCLDPATVRNTLSWMNVMARLVVWTSVLALALAVVWFSYEFANKGTDPHLVAWFSAGAFVLLGFPLSMGSIVAHLANYNQPHVQCYIVRILWMVPMYSMESWLCLRFHEYAIYIETLRDFYESFVLYSFLQFLIEVLGGEESLILMLKDKSPTRGSHMWGLQWCVKPWLMGQPVRRSDDEYDSDKKIPSSPQQRHRKSLKRVHWKSPFFIQCKFGVLQYVLLKFVCSFLAMILEMRGVYKEGNFTWKGGYLYICFITNLSQCWALYCLILFYYATHNELGPIRPVGKFLSVKALVFFTWWQSVGISILYQMDMIPHYNDSKTTINLSPEDVAKGIQDYLICIEMFFAAIVHTLVFPHTEYSPQEVQARARALNQSATNPNLWQQRKRLGRHHQYHTNQVLRNYHHNRDDKSLNSESRSTSIQGDRSFFDLEMTTLSSGGGGAGLSWEEPASTARDPNFVILPLSAQRMRGLSADSVDSDLSPLISPGTAGSAHDWTSSPLERPNGDPTEEWDGNDYRDDSTPPQDHQQYILSGQVHTQLQDHGRLPPSLMQPSLKARHSTIDEGEEEGPYWDSVDDDGDGEGDEDQGSEFSSDGDISDEIVESDTRPRQTHNFVRAFLDSAIPRDLRDNTVGIVKGDYVVEKKTLLHHATTSDHYDLFSRSNYRTKNDITTGSPKSRPDRPDKKS